MAKHNLLGSIRKTIRDFHLIEAGDRIAVGLSGGKDSMALLHALSRYRRFSPEPFELMAITVDPGFHNFDLDTARRFCDELGVPYHVEPTEIAEVVFHIREEQNPCSLCANMRRGTLASVMNQKGFNKLALGHHLDDLIETFFMNLLYTGRIKPLEASAYLSRTDITVIRPLIETNERTVLAYVDQFRIPVVKSPCPVDKKTNREAVSDFLKRAYAEHLPAEKSVATAIKSILKRPGTVDSTQEQCRPHHSSP